MEKMTTAAEQDRLNGFDDALAVLYSRANELRTRLRAADAVGAPMPEADSDRYVSVWDSIDFLEKDREQVHGARSGMTDHTVAEKLQQGEEAIARSR